MKKWLTWMIYFSISFFSWADYFLTNGEVTFYYDTKEQAISYLRGDALYPLDISRIRFYWIDEAGKLYDLQQYVKKVEKKGENILKISYKIPEVEWNITLIPSFQKKHLLFSFLEGNIQRRGYLLVEISPQQENQYLYLKHLEETKELEYKNFLLQSNRNDFSVVLSETSSLRDFDLQKILISAKKFRANRLYYVFDKMELGKEQGILQFNFYQKETQTWKSFDEMKQEEENAVLSSEEKYQNMISSSGILAKNLELLDLLSSRVYIPSSISYAKAKMSYLEKQQLLLLRALYGMVENHQRILEDVNLRKKELDSVYYFYYSLLYAEKTKQKIDQNLVNKRLSPQILSMYDEMAEDGRLIAVEDSLEAYASYYYLLSLLEERVEFLSEKNFIQERKQKLYSYIQSSFMKQGAFKDRSFLEHTNVKNIEYVFLLPESMRRQEVEKWYSRNYDKKLGIFHYKEDSLDMLHNLKMVSVLYEVGMSQEAEHLLKQLETYIEKSQNFVLESYSLSQASKKQELEISARAMYYYLLANWKREQHYGNER